MSKKTKEKFVTTIKGEKLPISKTRKYDSGFYKIGEIGIKDSGDCYLMSDGKYYREETGGIIFDYSENSYVFTNSKYLFFGIIDENLNQGSYSNHINACEVVLENGQCVNCMDSKFLEKNYTFRERLSDGKFYHIKSLPAIEFSMKHIPSNDYKTSLPYDSKHVLNTYKSNYDKYYTPSEDLINADVYEKILNGLSFGLEFETTKGFLPQKVINNLSLIPLRDGSILGIEYVTVPLEGAKGISNIIDSVKELKHRTEFDKNCALHLHLGNIPRTESFITAFMRVTLAIQDDLFSMFNLYKKYNFRYKNKNYSAPYNTYEFLNNMDVEINSKNLFRNFDIIFKHLTEGVSLKEYTSSCSLEDVKSHHRDPSGNQKWNIRNRYHVHNLIPLIFGNKTTIEFRLHTPTYDENKIIWFLLFNAIIVNYTIANENSILSNKIDLNLRSILNDYLIAIKAPYSFIKSFINYMDKRKSQVERFNLNSDIHFDESKIGCSFVYNYNYSGKTKSEYTAFSFSDEVFKPSSLSAEELSILAKKSTEIYRSARSTGKSMPTFDDYKAIMSDKPTTSFYGKKPVLKKTIIEEESNTESSEGDVQPEW